MNARTGRPATAPRSKAAPTHRAAGAALAVAALVTPLLLVGTGSAAAETDPVRNGAKLAARLIAGSDADDAFGTLEAFQRFADRNGGTRVAGARGHEQSAQYVYDQARRAGLKVSKQEFEYTFFQALSEKFAVVSPQAETVPLKAMTYSLSGPAGGITAPLAVVPVDDTTGCEASDYAAGAFTGKVALIKRGGCSFAIKQAAAAAAGAAAAVVYNNTDAELSGTLVEPDAGRLPVGSTSKAAGEALAAKAAAGPVTVSLDLRTFMEKRKTWNVLAETPGGDPNNVVMVGSHLDSVAEGPGINDNGSGSAGILEVAKNLGTRPVKNKVRFAWWSAEEFGLKGSEAYVNSLSEAEKKKIRLYLNFDMIASPNSAQFVYDGDDSDHVGSGPGPAGSAQIERLITDFFDDWSVPHEGTDFTGRSDYGPFIEAGIPAGGTDTGAEVIKTAEQAARYGGTAGVAFDKCYHKACDDLDNLDLAAFDLNIDAIANAVGRYAWDLSSLTAPVAPKQTDGQVGSGGGLQESHAHEVAS